MANDANVTKLYRAVMAKVHPDRVSEQHKLEATKLTQIANKYRDNNDAAGLQRMLDDLAAGKYFVDHAADIQRFIDEGKSKTEIKGYATFMKWPKSAFEMIDKMCGSGRAGSADKRKVVELLIALDKQGKSKADMVKALMAAFNWSEATGKTVVAHLEYMKCFAEALR